MGNHIHICNDKGYGCCEVPLNIHCDKIMHFNLVYNYTINHSGFLYSKINQNITLRNEKITL